MLWPFKAFKNDAGERRETSRLDKVFPVWLEGERGGAHGVARNISPGGLFVESSVTHPIGTQVRVTFETRGEEMTAVGEVRYACALTGRRDGAAFGPVGVRGMGIRFLYFDPAEAKALHEAIH
jgi:PilZ domain